mmetsp:Transcript_82286/g.137573  ORF Transcript_82286/g.137573 Transcript_82286/m.137573 type:complete len:84 (+) Transcript_82286:735-986(+)
MDAQKLLYQSDTLHFSTSQEEAWALCIAASVHMNLFEIKVWVPVFQHMISDRQCEHPSVAIPYEFWVPIHHWPGTCCAVNRRL